jgi:hypothetical protein
MVWARSGAIFMAFVCLIMARSVPEQSGMLRILAVVFPVLIILFPKKYELVEPQP